MGRQLRVLVACEYSGKIRDAFRRRGFDAWSNDLTEPPEGEFPEFHLPGDCMYHIENSGPWDLLIAHPTCTYLTIAAEWAYKDDPGKKMRHGTLFGAERRAAREESLDFVRKLLGAKVPHIALENPVGAISSRIRKPDMIVQPWQFGDDASKATCFWVKDLPELRPTNIIEPMYGCVCCRVKFDMAAGVDGCPKCRGLNGAPKKVWGNQTASGQNKLPPSEDRWKERSRTYDGIAEAIAQQWGDYIVMKDDDL